MQVLIGLGPNCELKYPAHPLDHRWNFPGVGEFQCYDKFMLATLQACADQVRPCGTGGGRRGTHAWASTHAHALEWQPPLCKPS